MSDEKFMRLAIEKALEGVCNGHAPFGACIVKDNKVVVCVHNVAYKETDPTAHAEVIAVREACKKLKTIDLSDCTMYATCEPCPMCFGASHYSNISRIVFSTTMEDAGDIGFSGLDIKDKDMKKHGDTHIEIKEEFLRSEGLKVFKLWTELNK